MVIRRIGVMSAAKIAGALYTVLGLLAGCIFAFISVATSALQTAATEDGVPAAFGAIFGVGAIIFFPIFYGIMGFVLGALTAALYNGLAGVIGGLTIETE